MTNANKYVVWVIAIVVLLLAAHDFWPSSVRFGSTIAAGNFPRIEINPALWSNGLGAGSAAQWQVDGNGNVTSTGSTTIGTSGTPMSKVIFGKCNPTFYGTSLAATTTGIFACAVTGVVAGDEVIGDLPQGAGAVVGSGGSNSGGFVLNTAYATTTGIVAFTYANFTGAATSSFPQATTSVEYYVVK